MSQASSTSSMLPYEEALNLLLQHMASTQQTEVVPIEQAAGRVLAQTIHAQYDAPRFSNSAMDGYAVADINAAHWQVVDYVSAGASTAHLQLQAGQAVRIFTGAAIPAGTEAVIPQENISLDGQQLSLSTTDTSGKPVKALKPGQNIRVKAEEYGAGDVLMSAGQRLSAVAIGLIASQGLAEVDCYKKLNVTVLSSGDELQALGQALAENQIYDSNRYMLLACLQDYASIFNIQNGGVLRDDLAQTKKRLQEVAASSDIILFSGGASVGDRDYAKQALEQIGTLQHWKLAIKPGKPFAWGRIEGQTHTTSVFLLPGNPVASWVTFSVLALPAMKLLAGIPEARVRPTYLEVASSHDIENKNFRLNFMRGVLEHHQGEQAPTVQAFPARLQNSAMLASCVASNALIQVPGHAHIAAGDKVKVLLLSNDI